ncbi:MAG: AAA family ATPase, partial [Desulfobacterales bacterium]|nr:AAA family ATPase [Desulfobacterales bacterium]
MKFPYGICDFREIITKGHFYCDRTDRIHLLERGKYLLFLRPRRFGKSLLLSMLANYYDAALEDQFRELFGHLKIGKNPTPLHNQYFILQWDFSCVDPSGSTEDIKTALWNHVNTCIKDFILYYEKLLPREVEIYPQDAISSLRSLIPVIRMTGRPVYLLIDEYDNFANEVM